MKIITKISAVKIQGFTKPSLSVVFILVYSKANKCQVFEFTKSIFSG